MLSLTKTPPALAPATLTYEILPGPPAAIRCLTCLCVSYNPGDIDELYCARCHAFHAPDQRGVWPPSWSVVATADGEAFDAYYRRYRATVEVCAPTERTLFRNRRWTVYYKSDVAGVSGVMAQGFTYTTERAQRCACVIMRQIL